MTAQYACLNDASRNNNVHPDHQWILSEACVSKTGVGPNIEIWYAIDPSFTCDGRFVPDESHRLLGTVRHSSDWQTKIFEAMQGESWSPNDEAFDLIQKLGLRHTSMSIGDVVVISPPLVDDPRDELMNYIDVAERRAFMVDSIGWKDLGKVGDNRLRTNWMR